MLCAVALCTRAYVKFKSSGTVVKIIMKLDKQVSTILMQFKKEKGIDLSMLQKSTEKGNKIMHGMSNLDSDMKYSTAD